jgi:hypothetical protein
MLSSIAKTPLTLLLEFQTTVRNTKVLSEPVSTKTVKKLATREEQNNGLALVVSNYKEILWSSR